jgi:hypothetical protein
LEGEENLLDYEELNCTTTRFGCCLDGINVAKGENFEEFSLIQQPESDERFKKLQSIFSMTNSIFVSIKNLLFRI